jgi:hypothetical protein
LNCILGSQKDIMPSQVDNSGTVMWNDSVEKRRDIDNAPCRAKERGIYTVGQGVSLSLTSAKPHSLEMPYRRVKATTQDGH